MKNHQTFTLTYMCLAGVVGTVLGNHFLTNEEHQTMERFKRDTANFSARSFSTDSSLDNHKPTLDCEKYKPEIQEEKDRGTFVIDVKAQDEDPKDRGGTITYSIVQGEGERAYFIINNETGQVRTNTQFDRDDPMRQKEFYLTVQAMDNGRPPLADVCSFKITVLDINDNAPVFDASTYEVVITEDLKEKSEVMRVFAYDVDEGENSRLTYSFMPNHMSSDFGEYFYIDKNTGVIYLNKTLVNRMGTVFEGTVQVRDNALIDPKQTMTNVKIKIVGSDKKSPTFVSYPTEPIRLKENFSDYDTPIAVLTARSNIDNPILQFELQAGKTSQTNKEQTFRLEPKNNEALIKLSRSLDYETIIEYQLTVNVLNRDSLGASVNFVIKIEDVNDEIPSFIDTLVGSVVENNAVGAQAMSVRAIDKDGTSANNIVSYELLNHTNLFSIDRQSGIISAAVMFDREEEAVYHLQVKAYDNSPSALIRTRSEPNSAVKTFRINIEDQNDNKPKFDKSIYIVHNISESSDTGKDVVEVKAKDRDTASLIKYSIVGGDNNNDFYIEEATGRIKVNGKLDYEQIESYNLTVTASDGIASDTTIVVIHILNENDEPPVFESYDKMVRINEEETYSDCILELKATDPDIKDITADQKIVYRVSDNHKTFLAVSSNNGIACVTLIKPLDRDKPNGSPSYQGIIHAFDNDEGPNAQNAHAEFNITLIDKNDNAPFLTITEVVWYENQPPGDITVLTADDYDSPENGAPFRYEIAPDASIDIVTKFAIDGNMLRATVEFDREMQKFYDVRIAITDAGNPPQTGTSTIRVIIGDRNDNEAKLGASEIFVYNYKGGYNTSIDVGMVYVDDSDDWDLPDKTFEWESYAHDQFGLNHDTGMITMKPQTTDGEYLLKFVVKERLSGSYEHEVTANVNITVKGIPKEAVVKSGSIRLAKTSIEDFIEKKKKLGGTLVSKKDLLQTHLARILNVSVENVDVFTVLQTPSNNSFVDVRFSAHGSPYYLPEKLNAKVRIVQDDLEKLLAVEVVAVSVSECMDENRCAGGSCSDRLTIKDEPAVVFTNKTSFVGVQAVVEAVCECRLKTQHDCLNGGTQKPDGSCVCPPDHEGPHCEQLAVSFYGDGWAMYETFDACNNSEINLEVKANTDDGLVFYVGPVREYSTSNNNRDFMSLQLEAGYPVLLVDYGSGTTRVELKKKKLTDGESHSVRIRYSPREIEMSIDNCGKSDCLKLGGPVGPNYLLNVNGPLQLGGTSRGLEEVAAFFGWQHKPISKGFHGCIRNFTYNGFLYDLGERGEYANVYRECNIGGPAKAISFGIDSKFLVAILVCVAILLILLLAVVVHRKKQDNWNEKDMDDARETIIDYQVEGGGEFDTQFDMNVLRCEDEEKAPIKEKLYKQGPEVSPDISSFLDSKKDTCDRDPDNLPYDDVRYYAYEGDGNSTGSLSSLASCTDDGDLKFNYLSNFGPRFRKLADMYGEDPSDEDSQDGGEESWC